MNPPEPDITVNVDLTNPGQFFACCGLLELADRLWPGAEGWFTKGEFQIASHGALENLLGTLADVDLRQLDADDDMASPMRLPAPFALTLDWWRDEIAGGKQLKVWAGSMRSVRIANAMKSALATVKQTTPLFDQCTVVYDPEQQNKKVEPYYFDSRRGWNAQSLDIGFAPDSLQMKTMAYPAVEFLCLVGLQRFRPSPTEHRRVFNYFSWLPPLPLSAAAAAASGVLYMPHSQGYRFENAFRTAQKKHKSFLPATPIGASL